MLINYSTNDINRQTARRAFNGTSFSPEKRGDGIINSYVTHMEEVEQEFSQWMTENNQEEIEQDLEAYRQKYLQLLNNYLHSHANVASAFIAGPANFPTRRNEKRGRWADNHRDKWLDFSKKQLEKLRRKYDPKKIAAAPIKSSDPEATEKLQAKLEARQKEQELMKAANKIIRQKNTEQAAIIAQLVRDLNMSEATARSLLKPDFMGRVGFPSYALQNNNANIRRLKKRIARLEKVTNSERSETNYPGGISVEEDPDDHRIRLRFPGKPDRETRTLLKSLGFRWSPKNTAWQRHLNNNGKYAVEQFLKKRGKI